MGLNQVQVCWGAFPDSPIRNFSQEELKIVCESPSYAIVNAEPWQHKPANVKGYGKLLRNCPAVELNGHTGNKAGHFPLNGVA